LHPLLFDLVATEETKETRPKDKAAKIPNANKYLREFFIL